MGTILPYVGELDKIPKKWHLCDGTEGTPNLLDGRFLEGNTTVGVFKEAGLPNILGTMSGLYNMATATGVFSRIGKLFSNVGLGDGSDGVYVSTFNASKYNPIYGASNTVQPTAYTVYYIIKMKK